MAAVQFEHPKRIHEPSLDSATQTRPFPIRTSGISPVTQGVGKIDLFVGYVQIATENNGVFSFQPPKSGRLVRGQIEVYSGIAMAISYFEN